MLVFRYFFWVYMIHCTTFFHQNPAQFLLGLVQGVWYLTLTLLKPTEEYRQSVFHGVRELRLGWEENRFHRPPQWVMQRFLALGGLHD